MIQHAIINQVNLCYEVFGEYHEQTIVLISGLGSQMIRWDEAFCQLLANQNFRVIRFDNRDSGCSLFRTTKDIDFSQGIPHILSTLTKEDLPYSLMDMAKDVIGLLDYLKIDQAHIAGRSMGGIIAQLLGFYFPDRILSLSLMMSTSLHPSLPPTDPEVMAMMTKRAVDPTVNKDGYLKEKLDFAKKISGTYALNEAEEIKTIEEELARSKSKHGILRQLLAMGSMEYHQDILQQIYVPVLVIHGTEDLIFHPDCAKDITQSTPNSELMMIEGMGHSIPPELYRFISESIAKKCIEAIPH